MTPRKVALAYKTSDGPEGSVTIRLTVPRGNNGENIAERAVSSVAMLAQVHGVTASSKARSLADILKVVSVDACSTSDLLQAIEPVLCEVLGVDSIRFEEAVRAVA